MLRPEDICYLPRMMGLIAVREQSCQSAPQKEPLVELSLHDAARLTLAKSVKNVPPAIELLLQLRLLELGKALLNEGRSCSHGPPFTNASLFQHIWIVLM